MTYRTMISVFFLWILAEPLYGEMRSVRDFNIRTVPVECMGKDRNSSLDCFHAYLNVKGMGEFLIDDKVLALSKSNKVKSGINKETTKAYRSGELLFVRYETVKEGFSRQSDIIYKIFKKGVMGPYVKGGIPVYKKKGMGMAGEIKLMKLTANSIVLDIRHKKYKISRSGGVGCSTDHKLAKSGSYVCYDELQKIVSYRINENEEVKPVVRLFNYVMHDGQSFSDAARALKLFPKKLKQNGFNVEIKMTNMQVKRLFEPIQEPASLWDAPVFRK